MKGKERDREESVGKKGKKLQRTILQKTMEIPTLKGRETAINNIISAETFGKPVAEEAAIPRKIPK